ncbi:LysR substrate-binding domain-containing protein [Chromobacterium piscinae]|uniref:LysR substrate-binding domain-containing protein n=1 Tax=Chromobacterium piscinae TaxID=686831 RepID=UPI003260BB08
MPPAYQPPASSHGCIQSSSAPGAPGSSAAASPPAAAPRSTVTLDRSDLCLAAAVGHAGVAIARRRLAQPLLDNGQLTLPLGAFEPVERYAYYLVHPKLDPMPFRLRAVIDWLQQSAAG